MRPLQRNMTLDDTKVLFKHTFSAFRRPIPTTGTIANTANAWDPSQPVHPLAFSASCLQRKKRKQIQIDASARFVYDPDPWKHSRTNWFNVMINLATYVLLMSDVMRTGAITRFNMRQFNMRQISHGLYSYFGSFAYEVITVARDSVDLTNITATRYDVPVDHARIWSYTFDTTSLEIRIITNRINSSQSRTLSCMNYKVACDVAGVFTIAETFEMLDQVVDGVASLPASMVPAIYPPSTEHDHQYLRLAVLMKSREVFILYDKLVIWFLSSIKVRSGRFSYWPKVGPSFDICADPRDRPYLCDEVTISDYQSSADPSDSESSNVTFIWTSINEHVRAIYERFHGVSDNMTIDVTVMEGYTQPMAYVGGLVMTVSEEFEIVILTRVRDCSSTNRNDSCRTIRVIDYRYEGGRITTDVDNWSDCVSILRIFSQAYYIVRLIGLLVGSYFAFPKNNRSFGRALFIVLSEAPSHVVAYGSFLPIVMYTCASWIDGPIVNAIIHGGGLGLQGNFLKAPGRIYTLICLLMRKQWLMACLTIIWIRVQVVSPRFNRYLGIWSVRGHIFGVLASMSMALGYYHPSFRDTRFLGYSFVNADISVLNARYFPRDFANRRLGGVYADLFSIGLSAVVYVLVVLVLRILGSMLGHILMAVMQQETNDNHEFKANVTKRSRQIMQKPFFFCQTDMLPSTCSTLWNAEGLTCGWVDDVFISLILQPREASHAEYTQRAMLMNIVQLTEPINYLRLHLGFNRHRVYTYAETDTKRTFTVVNKLKFDPVYWKEIKSKKLEVIEKKFAREMPFHELVRCR